MFSPEMPRRRAQESRSEQLERREFYFRALVNDHLINTFTDSLYDTHFSDEEVHEVLSALASLSEEDARSVLALPLEIRHRMLKKYHERISAGETTPELMVTELCNTNTKYGFTLGFHLSDREIPKAANADGSTAWVINGTEFDDRDERPMAYYSEDYLHRYTKKKAKYLYIVRAEMGEGSAHYRDNNNHWGRAAQLAIIDVMDMNDVEAEIEKEVAEHQNEKGAATKSHSATTRNSDQQSA